MTPVEWSGFGAGVVAIIGGFFVGLKWLVTQIQREVASELKPDGNGGHNFEGRLARLEKRVDQIYLLLSTQQDKQGPVSLRSINGD